MSDERNDKQIDALQAEVEQLRAQVAALAPDQGTDGEPGKPVEGTPSLFKVVVFSALLVLLALGFFFAVYTGLSKGFDSLAYSTAKTYAFEFEGSEDQDTRNQKARPSAPKSLPDKPPAPRVPGL